MQSLRDSFSPAPLLTKALLFHKALYRQIAFSVAGAFLTGSFLYCPVATADNGSFDGNPAQSAESAESFFEADNLAVIQRDALIQRLIEDSRSFYRAAYPDATVDVQISQIPSALENRACQSDPQLVFPKVINRSGNLLVSVRCNAPTAWKVFVPMNVNLTQEVLVATGPIARGTMIKPSHVIQRQINLDAFRDQYVTKFEQISGMIVKRTFRDGQVIRTDQLTEPTLVERGEKIIITAKAGQTHVKMFGTALSDGKLGDQIRVKNISSSRILHAQVTEKGQVIVPM